MRYLKNIVVFLGLLLITNIGYSQLNGIYKYINNDSIQYKVLLTYREDSLGDFLPSIYTVSVKIKDSSMLNTIKSLSNSDWLKLLTNEKSDWAANLLLYNLYNKDATRFTVIRTRDNWISRRKNEDVEYWRKTFK
ncbi:hypothetical protein [Limnovirga soli]|uniref:Uncharacterized protein n=1 Tax=Limnovirga soli TaxID=2656915 RepID=A0A8J8FCR9_9BACT|nr:hypothetical protein [Limnovirga soli]NNV55077.1 hypothetical protein [Limnovirga soli]